MILETVGRTARHHTFFEMLGNFSFGDYFKKDAITFAWDFLTNILNLPKDKLYITVYEKDDEAKELWETLTDVDKSHIFLIGEKDNFWAMGDTGPCGPCSEIFVDRGEKYGCDAPICGIGHCDCDRWMEIWNLVFMQYNRDSEGNLTPLPKPSIDTGMGLERITSILQHVDSNYDTDLMYKLIEGVEELSGRKYQPGNVGFPFRVIADHARSCTFLIKDGIIPSNEGRGYVLRRILRRAVRFGKSLGMNEAFLYKMVPYVCDSLGKAYPDLLKEKDTVMKVIRIEEDRFQTTIQGGLAKTEEIIDKLKQAGETVISGKDIFLLYDTFGFPIDLTKDIAEENGLTLDEKGFEQAMQNQREKAKAARTDDINGDDLKIGQLLVDLPKTKFLGYSRLDSESIVRAIVIDNTIVESAAKDKKGWLVLDQTPFYAESGGQTGDKGELTANCLKINIHDTQKLANGVFIHRFIVMEGEISTNDKVKASVDLKRRRMIAANHSATHLLHKALRDTLGDHVHQAGSNVDEYRLRFDFTHFEPLTDHELKQIEESVNHQVLENLPIECREMPIEEAKKLGALAFFGDKYGDIVRVVEMGDYSMEFCGGTHCHCTGEIGLVKILSENGIASGMRRIEMLTGFNTLKYYREQEDLLNGLTEVLKTTPANLEKRIDKLLKDNREMTKTIEKYESAAVKDSISELFASAKDINGIKTLSVYLDFIHDMSSLRSTLDSLRDKNQLSVIILAANSDDKVHLVAYADEKARNLGINAGKLIKEIALVCEGSGGGKPDMAQAGGKNPKKIPEAIKKSWQLLTEILES